jgi:hypothetical protein
MSSCIATEEFDESLDRKIRSLAAEKELVQVQIAERRSKTPKDIHHLMKDLVRRKTVSERIPDVAEVEALERELEADVSGESSGPELREECCRLSSRSLGLERTRRHGR